MSGLFAVIQKEVRELLRNRSLLIGLIAPVVVAVLFVKIADRSHSAPFVQIAMRRGSDTRVLALMALTGAFKIHEVTSQAEARALVTAGQVDLAFLLAPDYSKEVRLNQNPRVLFIVRRSSGPRTAAAISTLIEVLRTRAGQPVPVNVQMDPIGRDEVFLGRAQLLVGFIMFVLLMGTGLVATSLVEERERGTILAIRVSGASVQTVLLGKTLAAWASCLLAGLVLLGACGLLHAPVGGLLTVMAVGAAFSVCLGLWMGAVFPNMAAANAGLPLVFLLLFVPVFLEKNLQWTWTVVLPSHFLMLALDRTLVDGAGLACVQGATLIMLGWATACAVAAWFHLRST